MNVVVELLKEDDAGDVARIPIAVGRHPRSVLARKHLTIVQVDQQQLVQIAKGVIDADADIPAEPPAVQQMAEIVAK